MSHTAGVLWEAGTYSCKNFWIKLLRIVVLFISAHNSTIMFSGDCNSQTTNIYNLAKPYTVAYTTISSSVSRYKHQLSNRTQNHYSTEVLTTVNTGMYWYTLIICNTWLYIWVTLRVSYEMPFASTWVHPRFFGGVRVDPLFSFLCCPIVCFYVTISA
jgi:hypothetical protein